MALPRVPLNALDVSAVRAMHDATLEQLLCAVARMPTYQRTALRELMHELERGQLLAIVPNGQGQTQGDDDAS
jgi:hypothetical protein